MLKGQKLADAYADAYADTVRQASRTKERPNVWAEYEGSGWITLRGESLPPHYTLRDKYPNGWSLIDHIRSSEARRYLSKERN
jgi:hypothetical protein